MSTNPRKSQCDKGISLQTPKIDAQSPRRPARYSDANGDFVVKAPVLCLDCKEQYMDLDLSKDHQHLVCPGCERVWCAVCIARVEVQISDEWLRRARVAHLN